MNPQIKQLAEKAGFNVEFEPSDDENDRSYQVVDNDFAERFAELIVRECARALDDKLANPNGACMAYCDGSDLLEHFGVEE